MTTRAMDLEALRVFAKVAELASFSRAAEQLGLAKGRVSTCVRELEERVGARLLQRTTRRVRMTPDGERFLDASKELLADAEQLHAMFRPAASGLAGRLRIDLPHGLARRLVIPRLPEFLAAHPGLEVGVSTTDRRVDPVHEGFDCVLRVGDLGDSDLVARRLGRLRMCNAASPAYLAAHGTPRSLDDLERHRVVHYAPSLGTGNAGWDYRDPDDGTRRTRPMRAAIAVNGTDAFEAAALAGLGLLQAPRIGIAPHVKAGRLVEVLRDWTAAPLPVSLLYPNRRHLAPRVQAVMAWLAEVVSPMLDDIG